MAKYVISYNNKEFVFKNQVDFKNFTRDILINNAGEYKEGIIYDFLKELLKKHPNPRDKLDNISSIIIERDFHNNPAVFITYNDDRKKDSISWVCCITQRNTSLKTIQSMCFRNSIQDQIDYFRYRNDGSCAICDKKNTNLEVDHIVEFKFLTDSFIKLNQLEPVFIKNFQDLSRGKYLFSKEDLEISKKWQEYHKTYAKLQLLCKSCHLGKR